MSEETLQKEHVQTMLQEAIALCTVPFPNLFTGDQPLLANITHLIDKNNLDFLTELFLTHYELQHYTKSNNAASDCIIFVCGTILARMWFIKKERNITDINQDTLKGLFNDAFTWSQTCTAAITEYWQIQCHNSKRFGRGLEIPFFTKMPIYHPLQYHYLETLEAGSFDRYTAYANALSITDDHYEDSQQLADLPIWLGQGPSIEHSITETLNCFIADLMEGHCHLVIANGHVGQQRERIAFPFTAVNLLDTPDFLNYFGAVVTNSTPTQIGPRNINESFVYETKDYHVTTKKLPQFSICDAEPLSAYHNIETYSLDIKIKGRECAVPYHVVVHNIQTPDNNPALLNREQLMLLYKSVIKMKCEKQNTFVHCAAGKGRTGVMAYVLANLFVSEFPQDPLQAVKWLRSHRPNLIVTPQQLEGALKLSREMMNIHNELINNLQCKEVWQSIYKHLNLDRHLDYCANPAFTKDKTVPQSSFFHRKRKLITNEACIAKNEKKTDTSQPPTGHTITLHTNAQEVSHTSLTSAANKYNN